MQQLHILLEENNMNAALQEIVRALGGYQKVGALLWPEIAVDAAGRKLAAHLNVERPERLNPDQVLFLFKAARQANFHTSKRWFDQVTGYIPSEPLEPEDERAQLQRAFVDAVALQARIVDRIERLNAAPTLRAVAK